MLRPPSFFDPDEGHQALSAASDALERLARAVDFELFRSELGAALTRSDRSKSGRPPYNTVLMFQVLVLQTLYTLSDAQAEYQIRDRLSPPPSPDGCPPREPIAAPLRAIMRFVGPGLDAHCRTPRRP